MHIYQVAHSPNAHMPWESAQNEHECIFHRDPATHELEVPFRGTSISLVPGEESAKKGMITTHTMFTMDEHKSALLATRIPASLFTSRGSRGFSW